MDLDANYTTNFLFIRGSIFLTARPFDLSKSLQVDACRQCPVLLASAFALMPAMIREDG
jgi:hypothetical protein